MKALISLLKNTKQNSFHPIFYIEHPFPYGENQSKITRYKSKGHHTKGFSTIGETESEIEAIKLKLNGYQITVEKDELIVWNGEGIPADTQIRSN